MRYVVGGRAALADKYAASTSEVGRLETDILSTKNNVRKLMDLSGKWIDKVHQRKPLKELILDRIARSAIPPPPVAKAYV